MYSLLATHYLTILADRGSSPPAWAAAMSRSMDVKRRCTASLSCVAYCSSSAYDPTMFLRTDNLQLRIRGLREHEREAAAGKEAGEGKRSKRERVGREGGGERWSAGGEGVDNSQIQAHAADSTVYAQHLFVSVHVSRKQRKDLNTQFVDATCFLSIHRARQLSPV